MKESGIASLSQSFCVSPVELIKHLILKLPRILLVLICCSLLRAGDPAPQRVGGEGFWDCLSFSVFLCVTGRALNASKQNFYMFLTCCSVLRAGDPVPQRVGDEGVWIFCVSPVELLKHLILKLPRMESKIFTRF